MAFSEREWSTENILFWKALHDFNFTRAQARAICEDFLAEGGRLELNLPAAKLQHYRREVVPEFCTPSNITATSVVPSANDDEYVDGAIFDVALASVMNLMEKDTFQRFLRIPANMKLWEEFLDLRKQRAMLLNASNMANSIGLEGND